MIGDVNQITVTEEIFWATWRIWGSCCRLLSWSLFFRLRWKSCCSWRSLCARCNLHSGLPTGCHERRNVLGHQAWVVILRSHSVMKRTQNELQIVLFCDVHCASNRIFPTHALEPEQKEIKSLVFCLFVFVSSPPQPFAESKEESGTQSKLFSKFFFFWNHTLLQQSVSLWSWEQQLMSGSDQLWSVGMLFSKRTNSFRLWFSLCLFIGLSFFLFERCFFTHRRDKSPGWHGKMCPTQLDSACWFQWISKCWDDSPCSSWAACCFLQ